MVRSIGRSKVKLFSVVAIVGVVLLLAGLATGVLFAGGPSDGLERAIAAQEAHTDALLARAGVVGTAVTLDGNGKPAVVVLTESADVRGLPGALDGIPVLVRVSGKITAFPKPPWAGGDEDAVDRTSRFDRPVPIGVSTGHPAITAGTISARVKDGAGNVYALSNNHVYADENRASLGDNVLQPGKYDGGVDPADAIGTLADFEPIRFDGSNNTIDAAIALSSTANLGRATPSDGYGTPKAATLGAYINQKVKKYGRTTGQTSGQVYAINAIVNVGYDTGVARFVDQIVIQPGTFSAGGDSGSLVVANGKGKNAADNRRPVGLLFAGSSFFTIANPINAVLTRFGVTIDGE